MAEAKDFLRNVDRFLTKLLELQETHALLAVAVACLLCPTSCQRQDFPRWKFSGWFYITFLSLTFLVLALARAGCGCSLEMPASGLKIQVSWWCPELKDFFFLRSVLHLKLHIKAIRPGFSGM